MPLRPAQNDREHDLLKKIVSNTAFIGDGLVAAAGYSEYANFDALPDATANNGVIAVVLTVQGTYFINRKPPGLYQSNGITWNYLGELPDGYFNDSVLTMSDDVTPTKKVVFQLSGLTAGQTRTLAVPDASGTLYLNGGNPILDANGNELLKFTSTASAVNEVTLTNAATGSGPTISATGGDANIDLNLMPIGNGGVVLRAGFFGGASLRWAGTIGGLYNRYSDVTTIVKSGIGNIIEFAEQITINKNTFLGWSSVDVTSPNDVALSRTSARRIQINNGTAGQFGDLDLRALTATGQSLTGSEATSLLDLSTTWNTTGAPTALKVAVTNTTSASTSRIVDFISGSTSVLYTTIGGQTTFTQLGSGRPTTIGDSGVLVGGNATGQSVMLATNSGIGNTNTAGLRMKRNNSVMWENRTDDVFGYPVATRITSRADGLVQIDDGTDTGYRDLKLRALTATGQVLTGSQATSLLDLSTTWSTTGAPDAITLNVTDTASASTANLLRLKVGTVDKVTISKGGNITAAGIIQAAEYIYLGSANQYFRALPTDIIVQTYGGAGFSSAGYLGLTHHPAFSASVKINRDADNVLALRNSTAAQTSRVYRTYTDASNYERLALQTGSGYVELAAETAGTGTDNLDVRLTAAGTGRILPQQGVTLPAGTTAASSAPLKFTTQASGLSTVEQGAMELIGNSLQFTQLAKRRGVAMSQSVRTSTTTVENSATESAALITAEHGANYLEVGKREELELNGTVAQRSNPAAVLTLRVKYAGTTVLTITTPASTVISSRAFSLRVQTTVRSTGASGTMQINATMQIPGISVDPYASALANIDTTTAQDTTITAQWGEADTADIFKVEQGRVLCIETNK